VVWQRDNAASQGATTVTASTGPGTAVPGAAPLIRRVNYTVRPGDSLSRIAENFRVTVADILRWNSLDAARHLQPGQRLVLHVDVTVQSGR
jgi:membrane-bound lytic murein transglycosylase D